MRVDRDADRRVLTLAALLERRFLFVTQVRVNNQPLTRSAS